MGGYMQQLIEAVNASNATTFLDWAPIILSVISVLIAVYIPVKLARKENQIAIFEKLYAAYSHLRPICNVLRIFQLVNFGSARGDAQDAFGLKRFHAPIRLAFFIAFGERVNKRVFSAANAGIDLNERIRRDIRRVTDAV